MINTDVSMNEILSWLRTHAADAQLCSNSRQILAGDVFFALLTHQGDGRNFIAQAIEQGAAAIVYEAADFSWQADWTVPHLAVTDLHSCVAELAAAWYAHPDQSMHTVGITGTNGKTSCSQWIAKALSLLKCDSAVIGTLGVGLYQQGSVAHLQETGFTTPDAIQLQRALGGLRDQGAQALAIEVSSIGLDQGRLDAMHFDTAVLTNLTRDHLDYHGDMQNYAAAKQRLFDWPGLKNAIVNLDDAFGAQMLQHMRAQHPEVNLLSYSLEKNAEDGSATLLATHLKTTHAGTSFHLDSPFGHAQVKTHLIGRFNISNVLAVIAVLLAKGVPFAKAVAVIEKLEPVPGRMQLLGSPGHAMVVIDYAHTPDALQKTLETLLPVATERAGQLWCVFGCGGDRDPGKRPQMGLVAETAQHVVVTSDNPRTEDPSAIIAQIVAGMRRQAHVIEDRASAILYAIKHASDRDVILLAGKGHETYQDIQGKKWPFSDQEHASLALATVATSMKRTS